ncbi:MAG: hypothetical protein HC904_09790 [Blastochloris sp.]|nr:hypothetical protein [Blastochloris sp.]
MGFGADRFDITKEINAAAVREKDIEDEDIDLELIEQELGSATERAGRICKEGKCCFSSLVSLVRRT